MDLTKYQELRDYQKEDHSFILMAWKHAESIGKGCFLIGRHKRPSRWIPEGMEDPWHDHHVKVTPNVLRLCKAIAEDNAMLWKAHEKGYLYTNKVLVRKLSKNLEETAKVLRSL